MHPNQITDMTAVEMMMAFRNRALSPVEAARACLDQIATYNDSVNAYCFVDEETTLEAARRSEERYNTLRPMGMVDGIPVAIKDIFQTKGWPTLKGSKIIDPAGPWDTDAPAVASLRRNGMVPLGRTTTPEFGWKGVTDSPLTGVTGNPWDPTKTAGGSSGGSAAAVALGMGPLALGTDAGGSIRIPAGFCGIVGMKPTHGRAPMWPPSAFYPLAHVGPMTWTVEDAALLLDVLCAPDARDWSALPPKSGSFLDVLTGAIDTVRIAYSPNLGYVDVDPEIAKSVEEAAHIFEDVGAIVEQVDPGFDDPEEAFGLLFYGGAANALRDINKKTRKLMDPGLVEVAEEYAQRSLLDYMGAMNTLSALSETMSRFHLKYDLLLTPTLPIPAFTAGLETPEDWPHKRWHTWTPFTYPFNLTGQPAITVPCGHTQKGLPIAIQLVGAKDHDALVLRAAHSFQLANPLTDERPPDS